MTNTMMDASSIPPSLKILRGSDHAPLEPLLDKTVAVLGYGNQGHAHALNLRDSGIKVIVANRVDSPNGQLAIEHGFSLLSIEAATAQADLVIIALPDEVQAAVYEKAIAPHLRPGATVGFIHGFNIRYGMIQPAQDIGVIMVAPKGPGKTLRDRYQQGQGIPCLFAMHQNSPAGDAEALGLAWANGIGCARAGVIYTSFRDETDTDLFGEQTVLCGGMTQLVLTAFETLVDAGYPPELAYLECCHEVKQVADLVYERGLVGMMKAISNTAEFGAYRAGPLLIDHGVRRRMRELLMQIQDGSFAKAMRKDHENDFAWFNRQRAALRSHPIEPAGEVIRALMPWLHENLDTPESTANPHSE